MRLSLDEIVRATGGTVVSGASAFAGDRLVLNVSADSRSVPSDALFVCLVGDTVDGHDFAGKAVEAGAVAVLAQRDPFAEAEQGAPVILVADTVKALGQLAHFWRKKLTKTRVVGITGTAGKTTVKEVLAQILAHKGLTAKNPLNLNNQIGLPLSMLAATGDEDFWVMEAGISQPGDMDELGAILEPDIGLILNVGPGHVAGLGDRGIAHYKARLLAHLAPGGSGLISADYPDLVREARTVRQDLVFFSTTGRQVEYRSAYVVPAGEGTGLFRLWLDGAPVDVEVPFRGSFGAENVVAAAAAAHRLGLSASEIASGLRGVVLPKQRFACSRAGKWLVIDDSYNANPLSFARMLEAAREMSGERPGEPLVCVLGEMGELGSVARSEHEQLGRLLAETRPRAIFWKGAYFEDVVEGLRYARYDGVVHAITSPETLLQGLASSGLLVADGSSEQVGEPSAGKIGTKSGGVILFKGSRVNRLELFVNAFIASAGEAHAV